MPRMNDVLTKDDLLQRNRAHPVCPGIQPGQKLLQSGSSGLAEVYIERSAIITKGEKGREMWLIFLVFLSKTSRLLDL